MGCLAPNLSYANLAYVLLSSFTHALFRFSSEAGGAQYEHESE